MPVDCGYKLGRMVLLREYKSAQIDQRGDEPAQVEPGGKVKMAWPRMIQAHEFALL